MPRFNHDVQIAIQELTQTVSNPSMKMAGFPLTWSRVIKAPLPTMSQYTQYLSLKKGIQSSTWWMPFLFFKFAGRQTGKAVLYSIRLEYFGTIQNSGGKRPRSNIRRQCHGKPFRVERLHPCFVP